MDYVCRYSSPLGEILISGDGESVTGLWFENEKYYAETLSEDRQTADIPLFGRVSEWLDIYFSGKEPDFVLPLNPKGSGFRKEVWGILLGIPYGKTKTYGEIAAEIAERRGLKRMSAQAVGGAVGHNPISIVIPCHRVVGTDGSLTGYAGGLDIKIKLLQTEHADTSGLYRPAEGTALRKRCRNRCGPATGFRIPDCRKRDRS